MAQGPSRNVIVNEEDNRKLEVYTEGDIDASIDGVAVLGEGSSNTLYPLQLDGDKNLKTIQGGAGSIGSFRTVTVTAGTAVQCDSNNCKWCIIQALSNNTDAVEVGDSSVVAAEATQKGLRLFPGQAQLFYINNTNLFWVDSVVNGEGVSVIYGD